MSPSSEGVIGPIPCQTLGFSPVSTEVGLKLACLERAGVSVLLIWNFSPVSAEVGLNIFTAETPEPTNLTIIFFQANWSKDMKF